MDDYILGRLRADATHLIALAENEAKLPHRGMQGRFRELLIDTMLQPWLPPYVACGTGMIIEAANQKRKHNQDEVIVYDRTLAPPVLAASGHASDGVFTFNSALLRIEVKSTLTRADIVQFVEASLEVSKLKHSIGPDYKGELMWGAMNILFAFKSDAKGDSDYQFRRILDVMKKEGCPPLSGIISAICIPPIGFWKLSKVNEVVCWQKLVHESSADAIVWFVACASNLAFQLHAQREGRDSRMGIAGGIGMSLSGDVYETIPGPC